jgi:RNA polymerase sigma-70 factor (ECF subfamily)
LTESASEAKLGQALSYSRFIEGKVERNEFASESMQDPGFSFLMKELEPDDVTLIMLIAQAQNEAIGKLYDRYNHLVFSVAFAIIDDRTIAEEITLDVFVHVWRRASTYHADRGKVSTWLIAITRYHTIDILRRFKSHPEANSLNWDEISVQDGPAPRPPEEQLEISLQRDRVRNAVAQLPADQRQALALAYFKGYTHLQIAEILKQPLGTIKTRIRLAMRKLKQLLKDD